MSSKGYVYILTNPSMPGLVKIGMTTRSVAQRADELFASGVPQPFHVHDEVLSPDCSELESWVHAQLKSYRVSDNREFFRISPEHAENAVRCNLEEQINILVSEYLECHTLVDCTQAIGDDHMAELVEASGRSAMSVSAAISIMSADDLVPAFARLDAVPAKGKSKEYGRIQ